MNHLATVGPLSIALDASSFSLYQGGVFDKCDYDKNIEINHGVQLVGYGSSPDEGDYWLVRNSWYLKHLHYQNLLQSKSSIFPYHMAFMTGKPWKTWLKQLASSHQTNGYDLFWRGETWGENGYIRLRRESSVQCGIDNTPAMGLKCKDDGFTEQKVCGQCGMLFAPSYPIGAMTSAHILP